MNNDINQRPEGSDPDRPETAGTTCTLCGKDISPAQYRSSRAILVDESEPGPERETVELVCQECWADLESELTTSPGTETRNRDTD